MQFFHSCLSTKHSQFHFYLGTVASEEISNDSGKDTICFAAYSAHGIIFVRHVGHLRFTENINAYGILLMVH